VVAASLTIDETLCGYGKFGLESTKQVMWANLEASSLEAALHLENRSQVLAGTGGVMGEATEGFRRRQQ
jgi:enoyl-CoA hydratase